MFAAIWALIASLPRDFFAVGTNAHTIAGTMAVAFAFRQLRSVLLAAVAAALVVQIYLFLFMTPPELRDFIPQAFVFGLRAIAAMAWGTLFWFVLKKIRSRKAP